MLIKLFSAKKIWYSEIIRIKYHPTTDKGLVRGHMVIESTVYFASQ